jgi:hypothetical protein
MAERNWKSLLGEVRRGSLPNGISIQIETWPLGQARGNGAVILNYLGTEDALIAAGCLTASMIENRSARRRGGRSQRDEHGMWFTLHRSPTKAAPGRMKLRRRAVPQIAMGLPGVLDLFPGGISELTQVPLRGNIIQAHDDTSCIPLARPRPSLRIVVNNIGGMNMSKITPIRPDIVIDRPSAKFEEISAKAWERGSVLAVECLEDMPDLDLICMCGEGRNGAPQDNVLYRHLQRLRREASGDPQIEQAFCSVLTDMLGSAVSGGGCWDVEDVLKHARKFGPVTQAVAS